MLSSKVGQDVFDKLKEISKGGGECGLVKILIQHLTTYVLALLIPVTDEDTIEEDTENIEDK